MNNMQELRWHGRGGQGAKTASILLAKIAAATGKYIQAFPEYGPERMGAPVLAYTRISDDPIHQHCQVEEADAVIILDPTLVGTVDVSSGITGDCIFIINSTSSPEELRSRLGLKDNQKIYTVDADGISEKEIGRVFPNTPMIGAFCRVAPFMEEEAFFQQAEEEYNKKFAHKKGVIEGNLKALKRASREVQGFE